MAKAENMTSIPGGDYSITRPSVDTMRKAGWRFVCRYLRDVDKANGDKTLYLAEAERLINGGLTIVSNDETTGEQGLTGFSGAIVDARAADIAHQIAGGPPDAPIYFSPWDHDPAALSASQWVTMEKYLNGLVAILTVKRVGLYGGRQLVSWAFDKRLITYGWEAAGWKNGPPDPRMHIIQNVGSPIPGTDSDTAVKVNFGAWSVVTMATIDDAITTINQHADQLYRLTARGELAGGGTDGRTSLTSLAADLAILKGVVNSGVPVVLNDAQLATLAKSVAAELATGGLKLSGSMAGTIELGADA